MSSAMQPDVACVHEFRKNNSLLLACLDNMPLAAAIIRLDLDKTGNPEDFTFVYANEALAELENVPLDRLLGAAFYRDIFPSGDRKWLAPYWETASRGTVQTLNDFSPEIDRFLEIKSYQPCHGFCACILTDVSEKVSLERELEDARRSVDVALRNSLDALFLYDMESNSIINNKDTLLRFKTLPPRFDNVPRCFVDYGVMRAESLPLAEKMFRRLEEGAEEVTEEIELNMTGKKDDFQWYKITYIAYPCPVSGKKRILGMTRNIHEEVLHRLRLEKEACTDALTGLYNLKAAQRLFSDRERSPHSKAFFLFDLDDFKKINDTHGHQIGDAVLRFFADVLNQAFREDDIVFRLGGDEFAAFATGRGNAFAKGICERFFDILAAQADFPFPLHASIGIGLSETSGHSYAEFYRTADSALYKAKGDGKNRWRMERL